jgi:hypothetical protein
MKHFTRSLLVLVIALGAAALTSVPATAASGGPAYCGALNMLHDPTMLPGTGGAMDHDAAQGNAGMFGAVAHSGCG